MKVLRASPVSFCSLALALQSFIFCCCEFTADAAAMLPERRSEMKVLRVSPARFLAPLLQVVLRSCCDALRPSSLLKRPFLALGMVISTRAGAVPARRDCERHRSKCAANGPAGSPRLRQSIPAGYGPRLDPGGPPFAGAWLWSVRAIHSLEPFRGSGRLAKAAVLQPCAAAMRPFSSWPVGSSSWQALGSIPYRWAGIKKRAVTLAVLLALTKFQFPSGDTLWRRAG
jgi:hypothetical protein